MLPRGLRERHGRTAQTRADGERVTRVELAFSAWEASYLKPVNCGFALFQWCQDACGPLDRMHPRSLAVNVGDFGIGSTISCCVLSFSG